MIPSGKFGEGIDFGGIEPDFFLVGLLNEVNNRFQTVGDSFFDGISWKQVFCLNCIAFFEEPPAIKELAEFLGTSHQNMKQLLLKLERAGFVEMTRDERDGRKQRIRLTEKAGRFREEYDRPSTEFMEKLFAGVETSDLEATIRVMTQLHEGLKNYQEKGEN